MAAGATIIKDALRRVIRFPSLLSARLISAKGEKDREPNRQAGSTLSQASAAHDVIIFALVSRKLPGSAGSAAVLPMLSMNSQ